MIQRKKPMNRGKSQLKRSELKRGDYQLKRTGRLNPVSPKKRKQTSKFGPIRAAFKKELGCPCGRIASDCHELWGGGVRLKTCELRAFWLPLCRKHHEEIQDLPREKKAWVYALKMVHDSAWYDLEQINEYALRRIEQSEVDAELDSVHQWIREIRR